MKHQAYFLRKIKVNKIEVLFVAIFRGFISLKVFLS